MASWGPARAAPRERAEARPPPSPPAHHAHSRGAPTHEYDSASFAYSLHGVGGPRRRVPQQPREGATGAPGWLLASADIAAARVTIEADLRIHSR